MPDIADVLSAERAAVREGTPGGADTGATVVGRAHADGEGGPGTRGGTDARPAVVRSRDPRDFPVPHGREEEWRFTPLRRLNGLLEGPAADGKVVVSVSAAPEVEVTEVGPDDARVGAWFVPSERVAALALAGFGAGTAIRVPRNTVASATTTVGLRGEGGTSYGHVLIEVEESAQAVVVLDHTGSATFAGNVEVHVGANASLTLVSLQDWDADAVHVGAQHSTVERDGRLRHVVVTLGGDVVRLSPTVAFAGPGADVELLGLYFADDGQHLEHRLLVDHTVPDCRSNVTYKGALQGEEAHTVWIGDVVIREAATGTDTYELNRNLLLTDGARADSVPNLEIETGEIRGAGHASATGRFDDEQLFYLQARGIPADDARRMVVRGFFAEVIARIGVPELEERLLSSVDAELSGVLA